MCASYSCRKQERWGAIWCDAEKMYILKTVVVVVEVVVVLIHDEIMKK